MPQLPDDYNASLTRETFEQARNARKKPKKAKAPKVTGSKPQPTTIGPKTPAKKKPTPLLDAARGYADVEYGQPIRAVQAQINAAPQREANIAGWYQTYLQRLQGARDSSAAAYQDATTLAAQPAPAVAPGGSPEAQAAQANQMNLAGAFNKMQQVQTQNDKNVYDQQYADSGLSQLGWNQENARNTDALRTQLQGLLKEKGSYTAGKRQELKQQKFDNKLATRHQYAEEVAVGADAAADAAKLKQDAKDKAAARKAARQKQRAAQTDKDEDQALAGMKFDSDKEKDAYQRAHKLGPYKPASKGKGDGLTKTQKQKNNDYWQDGRDVSKNLSDETISGNYGVQAIQDETNAPFWLAKILRDRAKQGYLTPAQAKRLRQAGIKYSAGAVNYEKPGTSSGSGGGPNGNGRP